MSRNRRAAALARLAAAALALGLAAGCAGDGGGGGQGRPAEGAPTATPAPSAPPPASTKAPSRPKPTGPTAEELVVALRQGGLPVLGWTLITGPTDPDRLLGRPGRYTSKVTFSDRRLVAGGGTEAANLLDGGAIEVFATPADAARRVPALAGARIRVFRHGHVVLALSRRLGAAAAREYREALERAL
jgi:hypothetical protein